MKTYISLFISILVVAFLTIKWTQELRLAQFTSDAPFHSEWERDNRVDPISILTQPFHYLGKGTQSVVFESGDGFHVVKVFRFDRTGKKEEGIFHASLLAYDLLREETGLLYLHLNRTEGKLPVLRGKGWRGRSFELPLDEFRFVIQKKGKSFDEVLLEARNDPFEIERRLGQFVALLKSRTGKGVVNKDPNLRRNFGFLEDRAIELDFGSYEKGSGFDVEREISRYTSRLERWLRKRVPEGLFYLEGQLPEIKEGRCMFPREKAAGASDRV